MINPALQLGEARGSQREVRIELESALVHLLRLLELREVFQVRVQIVGLDERQVRFAVLSRLPRHLFFLGRGKFRAQLIRNLLRDLALDNENIRDVLVERLAPNLRVVLRVN